MPGSQVGHVAVGYLWDEAVDTYCWSVLMEAAAAQSDQDSQTSEGYHHRIIDVEISRDCAERFFQSTSSPLYIAISALWLLMPSSQIRTL